VVRNSASGFGRSMRWGVQDRKGVRVSAAAPGSRIEVLRGEFPFGLLPGYGMRGVGSLGGSVPLGSRIQVLLLPFLVSCGLARSLFD
jgi:hypothetical protein